MNDTTDRDPRLVAIPDTHGHAKGEHKPYAEERPLPLTARMLFLWFYHACRRGSPRFLMVADHMNYLTFEDPAAVNLVRRALKLAGAGDLHGAAETANVEVGHAAVVSEGLRRGMRYSIGAEVDNDPRSRPDAQNIVDAMRPDAIIRSVHFVPITHPVHGENWNWPFDNPEFAELFDVVGTDALWESYVAILVDAIERLPGHIIGHFYVPAVFGHWPDDAKLSAYEDRVLDAAAARGMAIEFNTRFLYRDHPDEEKDKYMTANRRLLRKAKQRGVMIAVGSDAHSPRDQGNAFDIVLGVLDELEINELVFPLAGSLRRVALRVVREPEPEPPPPVPELVAAKPPRVAADRGGSKRPKTAASANGSTAHAPSGGSRARADSSTTPSRKKSPTKPAVAAVVDDTIAAIADVVKAVLVKPGSAGDGSPKGTPKSRVTKPAAPAKAAAIAPQKPAAEAAAAKPAPPAPAKPPAKTAAVTTAPASSSAAAKAVAKSAQSPSAARIAPPKADGKSAGRGASVSVAKAAVKTPTLKTAVAKTPAKSPAKKAEPVKASPKPAVAKPPVAKPAPKKAAPPKAIAKKAPPAKAPAKKTAAGKAAVKKSAPVHAAAKKSAPAKKSANAKTAPPAKRPPARAKPAGKKASPAKKSLPARPAAKKSLRSGPARSTSRAKPVAKKSAKKPPSKRR